MNGHTKQAANGERDENAANRPSARTRHYRSAPVTNRRATPGECALEELERPAHQSPIL
jgi:hypothetical protein